MIDNPGSLCFQVFKARFFPNCSILEAKDSIAGSYAWKSILSARDVIRKGMVWRIGNGQSVRVKEDKWLPKRESSSIISPLPTVLPEARVSSLIEADQREWKTKVIQELFLPSEASVILGIPLSLRNTEDRVIWAYTPSGVYSTSSAYKLLSGRDSPGSSNRKPQKRFWKALWELRVPHKIKHFLWRACHNALPTKCNMFRRNIINSKVSELCNEGHEDVLHTLWKCRVVEGFWRCHIWAQKAVNPPPPPSKFLRFI